MNQRPVPPPPEGFVRVRFRLAYDGSGFSGFAKQDDVVTVEGVLEATLAEVLRHPVKVNCAGRTDRGVHARGQVISIDADEGHFDAFKFSRAMNRKLAPDMSVDRIEVAPPDFDARTSCTARTYRYHVLNRPVADPLTRRLAIHIPEPLDTDAMNVATDQIIGLHDFSAFSKRNKSRPHEIFLRRVHRAQWERKGDLLRFEINANAYTHQMVRSLVGMFLEIGRGRRKAVEMGEVLAAMDRTLPPSPAPPQGLVLWKAHYDPPRAAA